MLLTYRYEFFQFPFIKYDARSEGLPDLVQKKKCRKKSCTFHCLIKTPRLIKTPPFLRENFQILKTCLIKTPPFVPKNIVNNTYVFSCVSCSMEPDKMSFPQCIDLIETSFMDLSFNSDTMRSTRVNKIQLLSNISITMTSILLCTFLWKYSMFIFLSYLGNNKSTLCCPDFSCWKLGIQNF